jgi:hypothetical protein
VDWRGRFERRAHAAAGPSAPRIWRAAKGVARAWRADPNSAEAARGAQRNRGGFFLLKDGESEHHSCKPRLQGAREQKLQSQRYPDRRWHDIRHLPAVCLWPVRAGWLPMSLKGPARGAFSATKTAASSAAVISRGGCITWDVRALRFAHWRIAFHPPACSGVLRVSRPRHRSRRDGGASPISASDLHKD